MSRIGLFLLVLCPCLALAQAPPPGPPGGPGRGMPAPTNLKVLAPDTYMRSMFGMQAALGVRCDFCHNMEDRASDEKAPKVTARKMMAMVKTINDNNFNGAEKVSCYTCHHGEQKPGQAPAPGARGPGGPSGPAR